MSREKETNDLTVQNVPSHIYKHWQRAARKADTSLNRWVRSRLRVAAAAELGVHDQDSEGVERLEGEGA